MAQSHELAYIDGSVPRALTPNEQDRMNRPWSFETAQRVGIDKFDIVDGKYYFKIPDNVDCIYDY